MLFNSPAAAEFDRVHYPLPLVFEESPDPGRLQQVWILWVWGGKT